MAACLILLALSPPAGGQNMSGAGSLHELSYERLQSILPSDVLLLVDPQAIERFLDELDGDPPDWPTVYGHGHHDPGHDDRLFALNRERDAKRVGKPGLSKTIAFAWLGELSGFDSTLGGFSVSLGPKFVSTRWGVVRFKPEEAPGNLVVVADEPQRTALRRELDERHHLEIEVIMTGRLIPDESLVYDFSHDEEGRGLIMPFVRIERVDFLRRR